MRFFILPKPARKFYCSLKFIELWRCVCDHLSHKKIKVINFCWYIQDLISSACSWFTSFLWMNFSGLLLCTFILSVQHHRTSMRREELQDKDSEDECWVKEGLWGDASHCAWPGQLLCTLGGWIQEDLALDKLLPSSILPVLSHRIALESNGSLQLLTTEGEAQLG